MLPTIDSIDKKERKYKNSTYTNLSTNNFDSLYMIEEQNDD